MGLPKASRSMKGTRDQQAAMYFGLTVVVVVRMDQCSLIRFRDREFVVNTDDLQSPERTTLAAA